MKGHLIATSLAAALVMGSFGTAADARERKLGNVVSPQYQKYKHAPRGHAYGYHRNRNSSGALAAGAALGILGGALAAQQYYADPPPRRVYIQRDYDPPVRYYESRPVRRYYEYY